MANPFETLSESSKEFVNYSMKSVSVLSQGLQTIANEAAEYSKKSFEDGTALVEKLGTTKSVEQLYEAHT
uniref:phasin family protein n=1 Tax=Serratia marcescens TaxID=615 RepID=UPI0013D99BD8